MNLHPAGSRTSAEPAVRPAVPAESEFSGTAVSGGSRPDAAAPGAPFSRLLARQLSGYRPGRPDPEGSGRLEASEKNARETAQAADQREAARVQERENTPRSNAPEKETGGPEPKGTAGHAGGGTPPVSMEFWSGFAALVPVIDMSGPLASQPGATAAVVTVPVTVGSRLGTEIAAQFSDRNGTQTLTMKLDPENLGQVEVRLQAKGDHLSVRLTAGSREAEAALKGSLKELTEALHQRTGRYHQVEIQVDLKPDRDPARGPLAQDAAHPEERHPQEQPPKDRRRRDQGGQEAPDTASDPRTQEG